MHKHTVADLPHAILLPILTLIMQAPTKAEVILGARMQDRILHMTVHLLHPSILAQP